MKSENTEIKDDQRDWGLMAKLESASLTKCSEEALKSNV